MPLAAILSATAPSSDRPDVPRAQLAFAAQTLLEYQARQAIAVGARQLFIMVEAVTAPLSRLVDRLEGEGVRAHLVRDMPGLVRQLPREDDVLLFADGMIVDQKYLTDIAGSSGNTLLVVQDDSATAHLERVDGVHRWAGVARVESHTLFNTLDLIGDWDLVLTLLRAVVQSDARRIIASHSDVMEGKIALVDRQDTADLVGRSITIPLDVDGSSAGAERYLLQPVARHASTKLLRMQIPPSRIVFGAMGMAVLGVLFSSLVWTVPALLMFLSALTVDAVARQLARIGQQGKSSILMQQVPPALVALGIMWLGVRHDVGADGLHLGLLVLVTAAALDGKRPKILPDWAFMTPGTASLMLLVGTIFGKFEPAIAVAAVLAIASLAAMLLLGGPGERRPS